MINRLSKLSALKYNVSSAILSKNLHRFALKFRNFHFSKMDSVNKAAKGWSNPGISNIYEKTRPNYNIDSVEFLLEKVGALEPHSGPEPFTIVELGAGTGKFTRAVLKVFEKRLVENYKIIATEPLKEMCETFAEVVPNVEIMQKPASDLSSLSSNSADIILAAQCFHWFGMDQNALNEIHRILKPKGTLGIIWNLPDLSVSWIKTIEEWLDPKFADIKIPRPASKVMFMPLRSHGGFSNESMDETSYRYSMELDFKGIIDRYKGNSVVSAAPDEEKERILLAIENEMKTNSDTKDKKSFATNSVDAILAAMSFHWFYSDQKALEEIHRILKPKAMVGLIWYLPDRAVSWINNIEGMLVPKFDAIQQIYSYNDQVCIPLRDQGGFVNEGSDLSSFTYSQNFDLQGVLDRYSSVSVVAYAETDEKKLILDAIEQEMKTNPETKDKQEHTLKFVMKMHWFQKA